MFFELSDKFNLISEQFEILETQKQSLISEINTLKANTFTQQILVIQAGREGV